MTSPSRRDETPISPFHIWKSWVEELAFKKVGRAAYEEAEAQHDRLKMWWRDGMTPPMAASSLALFAKGRAQAERFPEPREALRRAIRLGVKSAAERESRAAKHERGENPSVEQQRANRKKEPKRKDYGFGLHVEYSPGNAAYFVMWHHEVLSIRPTWEAADEHARSLVANKSKDAGGECLTHPANKLVILKRTQSGEPPVVEHYETMAEAVGAAKRWMRSNPPGEHGRITIESRGRGSHATRVFATEQKNAFEWRWKE